MTRFPLTVSTVKQMTDLLSSIFFILFCSFDPTLYIPYVYSRSPPLCLFLFFFVFFYPSLHPFWCFDAHTNSGVWPWTDKQSLSSLFGLDPDGTYLAYTLTVRAVPLLFFFFPPPLSDLQHTLEAWKKRTDWLLGTQVKRTPFSLDRRKKTRQFFFFLFTPWAHHQFTLAMQYRLTAENVYREGVLEGEKTRRKKRNKRSTLRSLSLTHSVSPLAHRLLYRWGGRIMDGADTEWSCTAIACKFITTKGGRKRVKVKKDRKNKELVIILLIGTFRIYTLKVLATNMWWEQWKSK